MLGSSKNILWFETSFLTDLFSDDPDVLWNVIFEISGVQLLNFPVITRVHTEYLRCEVTKFVGILAWDLYSKSLVGWYEITSQSYAQDCLFWHGFCDVITLMNINRVLYKNRKYAQKCCCLGNKEGARKQCFW